MTDFDKYNALLKDHWERTDSVPESILDGKIVRGKDARALLEAVIRPGDRIIIEGNNQKQAKFLAEELAKLDPSKIHGLHMLQSAVCLDEHLDVFRRGIASRLDFAFSGPQAVPLARLVQQGKVKIGAIHTYLELYARYFTDLAPKVALVCAEHSDAQGNLYMGHNTEETPLICEATHSRKGIVIAQVEKVVDTVRRVDIPGDRVEFVVVTNQPTHIDPLFTRDPAKLTNDQILMGMMAIKGIYAEYGVRIVNHGIGYATAAIELLLPTYGQRLGLKGKICPHWVLNPHPTLIPAIEAGFVKSIYSFGNEPGMEDYIAARSDIFYTCHDGILRSNRPISHMVGHYGIDMFIGSTLQIDEDGNSSTATLGRISGFGGAPNLGCNPGGRRHTSPAWRKVGEEIHACGPQGANGALRGRKLVVQITPTVAAKKRIPVFVEQLDAVRMAEQGVFEIPPIMIYGEDITHIVTEKGIAYLTRCSTREERRAAIRAVAGDTPVGRKEKKHETLRLRQKRAVRTPEDLGISKEQATHDLLAAKDMEDLRQLSGYLYQPPPEMLAEPVRPAPIRTARAVPAAGAYTPDNQEPGATVIVPSARLKERRKP
jgi:malonate decarboxylase alpha subunit